MFSSALVLTSACTGSGGGLGDAVLGDAVLDDATGDDTSTSDTADAAETDATDTTAPSDDRDNDGVPNDEDCAPDDPAVHRGALETCNGVDDDCSGLVDDLWADSLGDACDGDDPDTCQDGVFVCNASGNGVVCDDGPTTESGDEVCDGIDNDCNGIVDDMWADELGQPCDGPDVDLCMHGQVICLPDGSGSACGPESQDNLTEVCDGIDNDCNGIVDDMWADELGQPCDGPDADACANGTVICTADGTTTTCDTETVVDIVETCDGLDNDCDGGVDEDFPTLGDGCDGTADADVCLDGTVACTADGLATECSDDAQTTNGTEVCDGADNDCNGTADDPWTAQLGLPCDGPDSDQCANGTTVCAANGMGTTCQEGATGIAEVCDGVDNDCNGTIDDLWVGELGQACDGGDSDLCKEGVFVCNGQGTGTVCNDTTSNTAETCNGQDDDCDGSVDENGPWLPQDSYESNNSTFTAAGFNTGVGTNALPWRLTSTTTLHSASDVDWFTTPAPSLHTRLLCRVTGLAAGVTVGLRVGFSEHNFPPGSLRLENDSVVSNNGVVQLVTAPHPSYSAPYVVYAEVRNNSGAERCFGSYTLECKQSSTSAW